MTPMARLRLIQLRIMPSASCSRARRAGNSGLLSVSSVSLMPPQPCQSDPGEMIVDAPLREGFDPRGFIVLARGRRIAFMLREQTGEAVIERQILRADAP